jgi:cytochrome c-type biogenesis protein
VLETFVGNATEYLHTNVWLAMVAVFVGGILTASNPCVLAMIPLMMSFVAGRREEKPGVLRAFLCSLVFVAGLGITFTVLGMVAALAGRMYGEVSSAWNWIVAAVCVVMGLHLAEVTTLPIPSLGGRLQPKTRGLLGALVLGLVFGVVSAPCAAPILVVLLTYLAGSGASVPYGGLLLLVYALGHSVLILLAGTSMGAARQLIENRKATRALELLRRAAGATVVLVGVYFAYKGIQS